jgi:hypothetical protein
MSNKVQVSIRARPLALVSLASTGVLAGAIFGATTNAVNGWVSPGYFVRILRWGDVGDVWRASIAQGIFEGLLYGFLFSMIFTGAVGFVSKAACPYSVGVRYLLGILISAYGCWALGGLAAMGLAALSPDFYRNTFIGVPDDSREMLRYAWVGGSIWGAILGGLVSVTLGVIIFRAGWSHQNRKPEEAQTVPSAVKISEQ